MISLRARLFLLVAATTALVWSLAAVWTVLGARTDIERVLDRRLREAAVMVASLGYENDGPLATNGPAVLPVPSYERQLSCQIWSVTGDLIGVSSGAPARPLSSGDPGFSEQMIDGVEWRVYTYISPENGLSIMVGDTISVRRQLVSDLVIGLIIPALVGLAALGGLLWIGLGRGLAPVRRVAAAIAARRPDDHRPLAVPAVPRELVPLTAEIDDLFLRIERLRARERGFLASAAHEMQTPLAGLRTHADIALKSDDGGTRRRALQRIRESVDRTARLVRQLLELSRQDASSSSSAKGRADLIDTMEIVAQDLAGILESRRVALRVCAGDPGQPIAMTPDALLVALRNLVENAVLHGPEGGTVTVAALDKGFKVSDEGTGIASEEAVDLVQPFRRAACPDTPGSGLGLAIASAAAKSSGLTLAFRTHSAGFSASVVPQPKAMQTDDLITGQTNGSTNAIKN